MEIARDFYLNQLKLRENNGFVKVITGIRRCGKSYLLFRIFKNELLKRGISENHIIAIALDNIENKWLREPMSLYKHLKSLIADGNQYYVMLDEIQLVPDFYEVLNSLLQIENVDVYATGSNSKFLSSDILTEFRGRGDEVRVYPLSFKEYLSAFHGTEEDAINEYMIYGGLPRILSFQTEEQKAKYLTDLFRETYLKDLIEHNKILNTAEFEDLINILASSIGSLVNPTKLENTFHTVLRSEITNKTIKKYMDYLQDAFLIEVANRYDIKGKKYIGTPTKIYFSDLGLRNAGLNFRQIEETHLMENMIYIELKRRGYAVDIGLVEIRENDASGKRLRKQLEVDFIAYKGSKKYYIQSAYMIPNEEKRRQEERPLTIIKDSFKKMIVVGNHIKLKNDDNGITTIGIRQFLLDENSLDL